VALVLNWAVKKMFGGRSHCVGENDKDVEVL
jgi:hypothetical protein